MPAPSSSAVVYRFPGPTLGPHEKFKVYQKDINWGIVKKSPETTVLQFVEKNYVSILRHM